MSNHDFIREHIHSGGGGSILRFRTDRLKLAPSGLGHMSGTARRLDIAIKVLVAEGALRASVLAGVSFFLLRALWLQLRVQCMA